MLTVLRLCLLSVCAGTLWLTALADEPTSARTTEINREFLRLYGRTRGFSLGRPSAAQITPDGQTVLFLRSPDGQRPGSHLYAFDVASQQTEELLTPAQLAAAGDEEQLSPEERARRERQRTAGARGLTSFQFFPDGRHLLVPFSGKLYVFDRIQRKVTELKAGPGVLDPKISPDGRWVGYVREYDVYVLDVAANRERQLTTGGTADVSNGVAEFVAQEEMNRFSGWWWAPDSQAICYQQSDAREVETWYVADPSRPGMPPRPQRYPRPGKANVQVRLGVIPIAGGDTVWLAWDRDKFPYLNTVTWPRQDRLTLVVQDRLQRTQQVLLADPKTGQTRVIHTAADPVWLNIDQSVPHWLPDGSSFLWITDHDAGRQLELVTLDPPGTRVVLPAGEGFAGLLGGYDESPAAGAGDSHPSGPWTYYCSLSSGPLDRQVGRFTPSRSEVDWQKLTDAPGLHSVTVGKSSAIYLLRHSDMRHLASIKVVRAADNAVLGTLPSVATDPPFWPTTEFVEVGPLRWQAAITRPRQFDPQRKYPVLVQVYGGPGVQTVQRSANLFFLQQWYADHGFIVVAIDNRGTPGRGRAWERALYGKLGQLPLEDQVTALQALGAQYPEMDLNRVGIKGWSFGGYLSALAVLKRPDVYHAAVAGAPVTDWEDYDTHYTERYLGLPQEQREAYRSGSLLPLAAKLERPLLLIHGSADDNVYFIHSLKLADALFRAGQPFELLVLKGQAHGVVDPQLRERLEEHTLRFFLRHLARRQ